MNKGPWMVKISKKTEVKNLCGSSCIQDLNSILVGCGQASSFDGSASFRAFFFVPPQHFYSISLPTGGTAY